MFDVDLPVAGPGFVDATIADPDPVVVAFVNRQSVARSSTSNARHRP